MKPKTWFFARLAGTVLLVSTAVVLAVWFGHLDATPNPSLMHFPGGDELTTNYTSLIGSRVELYGRVVATDPLTIQGTYDGHELSVTVVDTGVSPSVGEYLHVYGVAQEGHTIRAIDTVVYPMTGISFTYAVSALAGLWTVARFLNRWGFDKASLVFRPRESPLIELSPWKRLVDAIRGGDRA